MDIIHHLEQIISDTLVKINHSTIPYGDFDTCLVLRKLASTSEWSETQLAQIDFLSKRLNISKKLFLAYHDNGRKAVDTEITDNTCLELIVALLLKSLLIDKDIITVEVRLQRFNTLFKALDLTKPEWLLPETRLGIEMEALWQAALVSLNDATGEIALTLPPAPNKNGRPTHKTIPLTVLFYEGPIARAYLATLNDLGYKPEKIIELVAAKDVATRKTVGKWLPGGFRTTYAASIQRNKIHYWPKHIYRNYSDLVTSVLNEISNKFSFGKNVFSNAQSLLPLTKYSDCVERLLTEGLADKVLEKYLQKEPASAVLYTGGGIVPAALLKINHLRFLHIHPGDLPDIRGADCALWSTLLTGRMSATCFYMSPGIDTGDIIKPCWLPHLDLDIDITNIDLKTIYRTVYSFIDPWVRSFVLREVITDNRQYDALISSPQSEINGTTYHFMHQRFQEAAFQKLFTLRGNNE